MFRVYTVIVLLYIALDEKNIWNSPILCITVLVTTAWKRTEQSEENRRATKMVYRLENEIYELTWKELNKYMTGRRADSGNMIKVYKYLLQSINFKVTI